MADTLRGSLIRLAHENPDLQTHLLPLIKQASKAELNFKGLADMATQINQDAAFLKQKAQQQDLPAVVNMMGILCADIAILSNSTDPKVQVTGKKLKKFVDEFGKHSTRIRKEKKKT